jgi:hypothetical protein
MEEVVVRAAHALGLDALAGCARVFEVGLALEEAQ